MERIQAGLFPAAPSVSSAGGAPLPGERAPFPPHFCTKPPVLAGSQQCRAERASAWCWGAGGALHHGAPRVPGCVQGLDGSVSWREPRCLPLYIAIEMNIYVREIST